MEVKKKSFFESRKTSIFISIVSLILIICLLTVATYSWVESGREGEATTNNLSLDVDPDLDVTGIDVNNGKIVIKDFTLREVSSVDGRDVYVPDDSFNGNGDNKTTTDELTFREANQGDIYNGTAKEKKDIPSNMRYLSFSFYISAPSGNDTTDVFLSGDSNISGTGAEYTRLSIDTHDGNAPKVFSSEATPGYPVTANAVSSINNVGTAATSLQTAEPFITYSYVGEAKPLFKLKQNEKKRITITLWLEGASGDFPDTIVNKNDLKAYLNIRTTRDYTNTVNVVDRTLGNWVHDSDGTKECYLFVYDAEKYVSEADNKSYKMNYNSATNTWSAKIPQEVKKVFFRRWNPDDASIKWNSWGSKENPIKVPGAEKLYNTGSKEQKEQGLNLTYNLLANYYNVAPVKGYEAGLWGEFDDSSFNLMYFFDQSSYAKTDTDGYFNGSTFPFVNMTVKYTYQGESVTTNLRYRMYDNFVGSRMYRQTMFLPTAGYTVSNASFMDYTFTGGDDNPTITRKSKTITYTQSAMSNKRIFAYCSDTASDNYWGVCLNYLSNKGIYSTDTSAPGGVRYAMCYKTNTDNDVWKDMCRWNDSYSAVDPNTTFPQGNEWVYACVNPGYEKAIYCRMNGATTANSWSNRWNQSGTNDAATTNRDCSITEFGDGSYFKHDAFSTWPNMPGDDIIIQ